MSLGRPGVVMSCFLLALGGCAQLGEAARVAQPGRAGVTQVISLDGSSAPRMRVVLEARELRETLSLVSRRDGHEIWRAGNGDTLTLREGVIVSTSALTPDLLSVEANFPSDWLRTARPAAASRVHRYMDGEERISLRGFQCEYSASIPDKVTVGGQPRPVSRINETCQNFDQSFANSYWLDGSGQMVQSRQWLGPEIGYLRLNHYLP